MILTGKEENSTTILIECDCGCEALKLTKSVWKDEIDYYLDLIVPAFYSEQEGFWSKFKIRAKFIWLILKGKYHWLTSLSLNEEHLIQLRNALNEMIG